MTSAKAEDATLIFSCWIPSHHPAFLKLERLYREAFAPLGYQFKMVHRPLLESVHDANRGTTDGDCAQDAHYLSSAPESSLLMVDVVVTRGEWSVWSRNPGLKIHNVTTLNSQNYRLGYLQRSLVVHRLLIEERRKEAYVVATLKEGLALLRAGQIDFFIASQQTMGANIKFAHKAGTIFNTTGYAHLHPRHRQLMPAFTKELRRRMPGREVVLE